MLFVSLGNSIRLGGAESYKKTTVGFKYTYGGNEEN